MLLFVFADNGIEILSTGKRPVFVITHLSFSHLSACCLPHLSVSHMSLSHVSLLCFSSLCFTFYLICLSHLSLIFQPHIFCLSVSHLIGCCLKCLSPVCLSFISSVHLSPVCLTCLSSVCVTLHLFVWHVCLSSSVCLICLLPVCLTCFSFVCHTCLTYICLTCLPPPTQLSLSVLKIKSQHLMKPQQVNYNLSTIIYSCEYFQKIEMISLSPFYSDVWRYCDKTEIIWSLLD